NQLRVLARVDQRLKRHASLLLEVEHLENGVLVVARGVVADLFAHKPPLATHLAERRGNDELRRRPARDAEGQQGGDGDAADLLGDGVVSRFARVAELQYQRQVIGVADREPARPEPARNQRLQSLPEALLVSLFVLAVEPRHGVMQADAIEDIHLLRLQVPEGDAASIAPGCTRDRRSDLLDPLDSTLTLQRFTAAPDGELEDSANRQSPVGNQADAALAQVHGHGHRRQFLKPHVADLANQLPIFSLDALNVVDDGQAYRVAVGVALVLRAHGASDRPDDQPEVKDDPETRNNRFVDILGDAEEDTRPAPDKRQHAQHSEDNLRTDKRPDTFRLSSPFTGDDELLELAPEQRPHGTADLRPEVDHAEQLGVDHGKITVAGDADTEDGDEQIQERDETERPAELVHGRHAGEHHQDRRQVDRQLEQSAGPVDHRAEVAQPLRKRQRAPGG